MRKQISEEAELKKATKEPTWAAMQAFSCSLKRAHFSSLLLLRDKQLRNDVISFMHGLFNPPNFFTLIRSWPAFRPIMYENIYFKTVHFKTRGC